MHAVKVAVPLRSGTTQPTFQPYKRCTVSHNAYLFDQTALPCELHRSVLQLPATELMHFHSEPLLTFAFAFVIFAGFEPAYLLVPGQTLTSELKNQLVDSRRAVGLVSQPLEL